MIDTFKKIILAGVGATAVTKEALENSLNELVSKGRISKEEAEETLKKVVEDGKNEFEGARSEFRNLVEETMERGNFASKSRVEVLEARILSLETELASLKASLNPGDSGDSPVI
ncbi:MAG: phasin family protein [Puniceicoccaceae bacterium]